MKNNGGMTLIEVLVSIAIVFIIFLGMSSGGLLVLDQNIRNTQRDEAVSVGEMEMQRVRNTPFDNVASSASPYPVSRLIRGISKDFTVQRTVNPLDPVNKDVTIDVSWTRLENGQTNTYNHRVRTIVRTR